MTSKHSVKERQLKLKDYLNVERVREIALHPGGQQVALVVRAADPKNNEYYQNLWLASSTAPGDWVRLTRGNHGDNTPAWSPCGRYLAFLSSRPEDLQVTLAKARGDSDETGSEAGAGTEPASSDDDKPKQQIWLLDLQFGGEPRQLTAHEEGVAEFDWSPDGKQVVFSARTPAEQQKKYLKSIRDDKGPLVLDRIQHKHDGRGFLDDVQSHLHLVDVATSDCRQLTSGPASESSPRWSPTGEWIAFTSNRTGNPDNNNRTDLWLIDPSGEQVKRLTLGDLNVSSPSWSPSGERLAFFSSLVPESGYHLTHLLSVSTASGVTVEDLDTCTGQGWEAGSLSGVIPDRKSFASEQEAVAHARRYPVALESSPVKVLSKDLDQTAAWGSDPHWLDDERIIYLLAHHGQTRLALASTTGTAQLVLSHQDRLSTLHHLDAAAGKVALHLDEPAKSDSIWLVPASALEDRSAVISLGHTNRELLAENTWAEYRWIQFEDSDGQAVEGLLIVPPGIDPDQLDELGRPLPLLVTIHGGPMSYDRPQFSFGDQYWASLGYLLLKVNYRGSTSYGEAFCRSIQGDWGPREHDDVMSGVNFLVKQGWADPDRLYCTGFSQGGIMTNWAAGHTDQFRAAVSEHGMWDYITAYGTDDCHLWWQDDLGVPWQNPAGYRRISPASGASQINTPLLITAGEHDWRCPLDEAEQLYMTLKKRGVDTRLVIYQDEHHAISKPKRAMDRLHRVVSWLAQYGGQPVPGEAIYPGQ